MNWAFIEENYPNYYSCDIILLCDILKRKLENEAIYDEDEKMILGWDVEKVLTNLEEEIYLRAFAFKF